MTDIDKTTLADDAAKVAEYVYNNKDAPPVKNKWKSFKDKLVRYCGALVLEKDKKDEWVISTGKVSWWLSFLPALYIFIDAFLATKSITSAGQIVNRDITPHHLTVLLTLATYNFGKKVADVVKSAIDSKSNGPG